MTTNVAERLNLPLPAIADFCCRNHIRRLAIFGSALTDRFRPDSDIDVLVEFEPGHSVGFAFVRIEDELSDLLGRKVDLNTSASLCDHIRPEVQAQAEVIYSAE